jgi:hypothetical protein
MKKFNLVVLILVIFVGSSQALRAQFLAVDDQFTITASAFPMVVGNVLANDNLSNPSIILTNPISSGVITLSTNGDVAIAANLEPMTFTITYTICIPGSVLCSTAICMVTITPVPPVAPFTQTLPFNSTVANLVVTGQDVLWYANPSAGRSVNELPLSATTPLVNGSTYYATQTVNGIESKERMPVTVTLSALATANYTFANFTHYFDSRTAQLTIENGQLLDELSLYSISGQIIASQIIQSRKGTMSLATLAAGTYVAVVKANGNQFTFKFVR